MINSDKKLYSRIISSLVMLPIVLGTLYLGGGFWFWLIVILALIAAFEWWGLCQNDLPADKTLWIVGIIYIIFAAWGFLTLREQGFIFALQILLLVMVSDIGAYIGGKIIGGARLIPQISPNKTYAGLLCGWGVSLVIAIFIFDNIIGGILIAPLSQLGDIAVSVLKRRADVKDSGRLIPGHGGVLDRLDGYLIIGSAVFLWGLFGGGGGGGL